MNENKNHWYDGWFYDNLIAPNQDRLFSEIKKIISPGSSVIDVGCGTGRLAFQLEDKVSEIVGIDISQKNISIANLNLKSNPSNRIKFIHNGIKGFSTNNGKKFDYAVITYVIHEMPPNEREEFLKNVAKISNKIIIGDYLIPRQGGFWNLLNELFEFAAGGDHYRNFKDFANNGGINSLISKLNYKILDETINKPKTAHLVIVEPR